MSSSVITRPCPSCRRTQVGRISVVGARELVEEWPRCVCESGARKLELLPDELSDEERSAAARKTGICMDCESPVEGQKGWALRCAVHKRAARTRQEREYRSTPKGIAKRKRQDAKLRRSKSLRAKRSARRRKTHAVRMANDPEYAAKYRRRRQRETSVTHPSYQKRIDYFNRTNGDPERAQRKRDWAIRKYYEEHPERPRPICATCSMDIEWAPGHGRPPKYHQTRECNPWLARLRPETAARRIA